MALDLTDYEAKARVAVQAFWGNREQALAAQQAAGRIDIGQRGAVTSGKNMDGFIALMMDLVQANGLVNAQIHRRRTLLTLPGYFRPTKLWDLLITHNGALIAALECKSQVGPSFGNNTNNRAEEAIGTAHDFWTAYREGAFGNHPRPFVGWLILVEDAPASRRPVRDISPHFPVFAKFQGASYLERYNLLCRRLIQEQLYTAACVITSPSTAATDGHYEEIDSLTGLRAFVATFAGHIAATAARG
jgi:hypothetical protein